jgi:hypothetical protein
MLKRDPALGITVGTSLHLLCRLRQRQLLWSSDRVRRLGSTAWQRATMTVVLVSRWLMVGDGQLLRCWQACVRARVRVCVARG